MALLFSARLLLEARLLLVTDKEFGTYAVLRYGRIQMHALLIAITTSKINQEIIILLWSLGLTQ